MRDDIRVHRGDHLPLTGGKLEHRRVALRERAHAGRLRRARLAWLERLAGLGKATGDGPVDIVGIYKAIANTAKPIRVFKYVKPPSIRGRQMRPYTEEYHNVIVASVEDGETIEVGTMEVLKQVQLQYTHMTRGGRNNVLNNLNVGRDSSTSPPSRYR